MTTLPKYVTLTLFLLPLLLLTGCDSGGSPMTAEEASSGEQAITNHHTSFVTTTSSGRLVYWDSDTNEGMMDISATTEVSNVVGEVRARVIGYIGGMYCLEADLTYEHNDRVSTGKRGTCFLPTPIQPPQGSHTGYHYYKDGSYEGSTTS